MLGAFMAVLDIQITNSSLPDILGSPGATLDEGSWISTSYLVAEIIVIPLTAWLAEVFGTRRCLLANTVLFPVFSIACAFAWNLGSMIAFRVLQGFTGGVLIPMAFTLVLKLLPPAERPFGYGLFGMTATFAPAIGPTIGGWLTDNYGWPAIFYLNLVPGVLMLAAIARGAQRRASEVFVAAARRLVGHRHHGRGAGLAHRVSRRRQSERLVEFADDCHARHHGGDFPDGVRSD